MNKGSKLLEQGRDNKRTKEVKKILDELLPLDIIRIIEKYDNDAYFLYSATHNTQAFCYIGKFLTILQLIQFFQISKDINIIAPKLIHTHCLSISMSTSRELIFSELSRRQSFNLKILIIAGLLSPNEVVYDEPLIIHAIESNNPDLVGFLMRKKAEIKSVKFIKENNLITLAFKLGYTDIVKMLLPYFDPISPQLRSNSKSTLLMQAIEDGDIKWIKKLLPKYLAANKFSDLLNIAVSKKSYQITRLLLENGVKIASDFKYSLSPLQIFIERCNRTSFTDTGADIIQNYRFINSMFILLLKHGDSLEKISPSYIRQIFCNDEPVLSRVIISHGGSAEEINIFDILKRLEKITVYLQKARDWDTLIFWLNLFRAKIPNIKSQFQQFLNEPLEIYQESWGDSLFSIITNHSRDHYVEKIWHYSRAIINIAIDAEKVEDWSHILFFTKALTKNTKKYFRVAWQEISKSRQRSDSDDNDLSDSKPLTL